jgi:diguanylate cyclase (GGDEF)-like protein/PAS domain S-box-containing protein
MAGPLIQANLRIALTGEYPAQSVSDGIKSLLGFHREEFLASKVTLKDRVHPDDADVAAVLFSPQIQPPSGAFNIRLRHSDGRIRCIKGHYKKELDLAGGHVVLDLVLTDARCVRETGDRSLAANFKTLIGHAEDFIYIKNRNHVILAASLPLSRLADSMKDGSELVGKTDYDIHSEESADTGYRLERQVLAQGQRTNEIQRLTGQDGKLYWIDNRKYPINNRRGEIVGILGIAPDITVYVEAELKMRQSEESLREAQSIAGLGSYVLDIPSGKWTSSSVLDDLLGIDEKSVRTVSTWLELVHPDDRAMMSAHLADDVIRQGGNFDREYRVVRLANGEVRWVLGRGKLDYDADGRPALLRGTIQNITESKRAESALRENKELLRLFIEHAPAALAMFDREMRYVAVSRRWIENYSLEGRELIGHSQYEVLPEIPQRWRKEYRRVLAGKALPPAEDRFERADGTVQWLRRELMPWRAADGAVGGIVIFTEDITKQKLNQERLGLAATVFTHAREGITITDPSGTILDVNDAFTRITGYSREEVLGRNPRILNSGLQNREFYANMWRCLLENGEWSGEIWNRAKSGDIFAERLVINAIRDANGSVAQYVALFSDVTDVKEHEQQLEHVVHYDMLTGLPNRVLLADRLRQAMSQAHRRKQLLAVAYLDIDAFKVINDRYGHTAGDIALTTLAGRLKTAIREGDTLARLGGDEFVAVLLDLDDAAASVPMLDKLLEAASQELQIDGEAVRVSASIGITFYPQPEDVDEDRLVRQADQAMYQAKLAGRNQYQRFDPTHDLSARGHHENLEHIRRATAAREFVLFYQPKVNMRTGKVIGVEALIRWQHPQRGLLPPAMFLPVIEGHPLAVEVGEWVIDSALAQMEAWRAEGLDMPVSVNVGALQLQQANFVDRLCALLAAHPMAKPGNLEIEVIETSALQDVAQTSQVLNACHELGVSFALDDFGTGYSSLTYLKRLPADVLKIDQSFVSDMLENPENLTILEGVLGLASAFRLQVIAEGVETVGHGLMLLQLGCELAQGFGIARPMPARNLPAWAAGWRADPRWANVPSVNSGNRQVLYASVEHRAWHAALEAYLLGKRHSPPTLDPRHCRFGVWLDAEGQLERGSLPAFKAIQILHRQFHALATEIFTSQAQGHKAEGLARLNELKYLRDEFLKQLDAFRD